MPALPQNKFRDSNLVDESDHTRTIMSPREATEKLNSGRDNYNIKSQTVRHRPKAEIMKLNTFYQYKANERSKNNDLAIRDE